jgi:hypothetical protein
MKPIIGLNVLTLKETSKKSLLSQVMKVKSPIGAQDNELFIENASIYLRLSSKLDFIYYNTNFTM